MAKLLARLGRFSARRPWAVLLTWLVVLAAAIGGFAVGHGELTTAVSIPGTATQEVADSLAAEFPDAAGKSGTVVIRTDDGSAFTDEQKQQIGDLLAGTAALEGVKNVVNPFDAQAQLDQQAAQVADGQTQIDAARTQLQDGQTQLDAARTQLDAGTAQLDAAQAQIDAGVQQAMSQGLDQASATAMVADQQAQLDAQRSQLEQGAAQLDQQQKALDAGRDQLSAQSAQLEDGQALLDQLNGMRTVSEDGSTALAQIQFASTDTALPTEIIDPVVDQLTSTPIQGVTVLPSYDVAQGIPSLGGGEMLGLAVAAIVLFVMLGTLVGVGLPLLNALLGVAVSVIGTLALSGTIEMLSITPILGVMLGLAVGIDYSLFIINRHRVQLRHGMDLRESIARANGTSGNAVLFAGLTVFIALLALNLTGIPFLGLLGTVGAVSIAMAVLVALTVTPAALSLMGPRILRRAERARLDQGAGAGASAGGAGTAAAEAGTHPSTLPTTPMPRWQAIASVVVGIAVLVAMALPALQMRLGLPDGSSEPVDSSAHRAFTAIAEEFGPGMNSPLLVTATLPGALDQEAAVHEEAAIGGQLSALADVQSVVPIGLSQDATTLAFQVVPTQGPSAESTEALVHNLRALDATDSAGDAVTLGVAGSASGNIDISEKLSDVLPIYLAVVVGLSFLILIVVFRSILVPLTATLGFVLSILAAFGGVTAVFQLGWGSSLFGVHDPAPVLSFLPIIQTGVLFGLAMDYQLFLVSGMREAYVQGSPARVSVRRGRRMGRAVVTCSAIIMVSVFAGFILNDSLMVKSIGFSLSLGVLLDAFLVRMLIIPGAMHLMGDAAWWLPKWLDRILPDLDIEGASLDRRPARG
ncbi:MAG: MMPL family transporter [Actinomyces sp.]|jgi:RND superfamily putative drug exporter|nr:MMPL family transporter [Actinomyces sp.]MCI1641118.1 MMPL family transporter [Actinomyces sp.]MCI1662363.1 MMPL family transporter [Actinomyces sp.]MCI1691087.1 MMPL family transporter [Actinomyces sp.]MCI1787135.1 MMPL family transporter [Actinomyces sp.]MCI1829299.1 MMPL family transporter [Actinomyces sp.]